MIRQLCLSLVQNSAFGRTGLNISIWVHLKHKAKCLKQYAVWSPSIIITQMHIRWVTCGELLGCRMLWILSVASAIIKPNVHTKDEEFDEQTRYFLAMLF